MVGLLALLLASGHVPQSARSNLQRASELVERGRAQLYRHDFAQARQLAQHAIDLHSTSGAAWILLGEAAREQQDFDGAYRAWLRANELDPKNVVSTYYLGRLFYEADRFDQAAAWLRETLRLQPRHFAAMTYLGLSAEALDLSSTAEQLYRAAIAESKLQKSPYSWAWLSLAKLLRNHGDEQGARALLDEGEKVCPEPHLLTQLGQLLVSNGELERAESVLLAAVQKDPTIAAAHYTLARIYRQQGKMKQAEDHADAFQRAKAVEPVRAVIAVQNTSR
jgi:tetratricopeptide (TPR) repeat protein